MIERDLQNKEAKELYLAISKVKDADECEKFMRDLCTFPELEAMIDRYQVAKRVKNGETYRAITAKTGISSATVTRVAHWLHHGTGGYNLILDQM